MSEAILNLFYHDQVGRLQKGFNELDSRVLDFQSADFQWMYDDLRTKLIKKEGHYLPELGQFNAIIKGTRIIPPNTFEVVQPNEDHDVLQLDKGVAMGLYAQKKVYLGSQTPTIDLPYWPHGITKVSNQFTVVNWNGLVDAFVPVRDATGALFRFEETYSKNIGDTGTTIVKSEGNIGPLRYQGRPTEVYFMYQGVKPKSEQNTGILIKMGDDQKMHCIPLRANYVESIQMSNWPMGFFGSNGPNYFIPTKG